MQGAITSSLLSVLSNRLPVLLILLVGFIIALIRWKKHPAVSIIMVVIFALEILVILPLSAFAVLAPLIFLRNQVLGAPRVLVQTILLVVDSLASGLIWILLLVAIFGWRQAPVNPNPPREDGPTR